LRSYGVSGSLRVPVPLYAGSVDTLSGSVRLTAFSHGAGCACKLAPQDLQRVMALLGPSDFPPEVLVGPQTGDDAAVYRLPGGLALVQTTDFFTPIVDDPFDWGRIAATNALSDVYAMGGRPLTALNIVAWPIQELPVELLAQVLAGGAQVAREAGVAILGGHSIHDPEPKYGMAVTGLVDPERIVRNATFRPGDVLLLTKPLGLGILSTAVKRGVATVEQLAVAVATMTTLNRAASEAMLEIGPSAATDVTGFGLLGHLHIALRASGVAAQVEADGPALLPGTLELAGEGVVPGGTRANHRFVAEAVRWNGLPEPEQFVLADAQTSGGLLVGVPEARSEQMLGAMVARGVDARAIGRVVAGPAGAMTIHGRLAG
jgi:selenide, water dikinase